MVEPLALTSTHKMWYFCTVQPSQGEYTGAIQMGSQQFWKQPYRVPASSDPDIATAQTIEIMCGHVRSAAGDDVVRATAGAAAQQFGGLSGGNDAQALAGAAWWWCKTFVKFVHHEFIIRQLLGEAGHLQGLISPEVLVRMDRPKDDCAIFSECVAAFLGVYGIPYEFVTVAVNPDEPEIFSHVFLYAVMPDGSRLPLDASHGDYPGWQVPSSRVSRRQVWDADGRPVADRGSRFDGLHNYGMRGLGAEGDWGGEFSPTPTPFTATDPYLEPGGVSIDLGPGYFGSNPAGSYTAPSQNSSQWALFATNLAKMGFTLAQINAIQPGTVVSANGAILRQNPGYSVPIGSQVASALGGGNVMLYLGLAFVGLVLVSSMGKGR